MPGPGNSAEKVYGEMGKYATAIDPSRTSKTAQESAAIAARSSSRPGRLRCKLAEGDRWATADDFKGQHAVLGRARARFGAAVRTFDANGDGKLDLYLAAAIVGPKGLRDALLLNKGDGKFEDATAAFGLPLDQASLGVAAADFDADRQIDLFLTGVGKNRLLRNRDGKAFEDVTVVAQDDRPAGDLARPPAGSTSTRMATSIFTSSTTAPPSTPTRPSRTTRLLRLAWPIRSIAMTASQSPFRAARRRPGLLWPSPGKT